MRGGKRVVTVVPALDEGPWIEEVLATTPAFVDAVIVVDDASEDDTVARAKAFVGPTQVEVLRHPSNRGVGAAIVTGYRRALALGADIVVVMAGDGQMDPTDLERVIEPIVQGHADYVKGNRLHHAEVRRSMPKDRYFGSLVLSRLTAWSIGVPVQDSQCGYTAIGRALLLRLDLDAVWPRFGYPNDLLAAIARGGGRIAEVQVRPVYRGEQSHLRAYHVGIILYLIGRAALRRVASRAKNGGAHARTNPR